MNRITVSRNMQFMYEHALGQLELREGFGVQVQVDPLHPWEMHAKLNGLADDILARAAYVGEVDGASTIYSQLVRPKYRGGEYNRTRSENQYLTHWIYPYKGKFHPQMIRAILNAVGAKPGWIVVDPLCGSGTALLESQLLGIDCVGVDISPLCALLSKVKTHAWRFAHEIREATVALTRTGPRHPDEVDPSEWQPQPVADFVEVARMVTYSDAARRKRDPRTYFVKNLTSMLESVEAMARAKAIFDLKFGRVEVVHGDCRELDAVGIAAGSVDAVITSPPYSIALDYVQNDEHALRAMGHSTAKLRKDFIGVRGRGTKEKLAFYERDMKDSLAGISRVLRPGG
ncbi:MAG: hypothetical protein QGH74_04340, partial [Candidatus Brocadiia bacterium]|nr:hypothetical protein [Candidatus Brocadiia bacterium]